MSMNLQHFKHIDGLRALAVISVIFFHFNLFDFSGGYLGVDIFFVISGFLITRLISNELHINGTFNYKNFYLRRVRRLLPALIVVLLISTIAALILFTPENLSDYGLSLSAAAASLSNILFWTQSGYFDSPAQFKPLLHTWSLSVEEQFYLIWPAIIFIVFKFRFYLNTISIIILIACSSFILNVIWVAAGTISSAQTIFFLTPFRVFEFAIGAMAVCLIDKQFLSSRVVQEILCVSGVILCITSMIFVRQQDSYSFLYAVPACVGAVLIILSPISILGGILFSNRISVFVGVISYSLYLVHWPVLVFSKYSSIDVSSSINILMLFIISLLLSIFIYFFIEKPFRNPSNPLVKSRVHVWTLVSLSVFFVIGIAIHFFDRKLLAADENFQLNVNQVEVEGRLLTQEQIAEGKSKRYKDLHHACTILTLNDAKRCHMNRPIQILVFGNSHEPDAFNMLMQIYETNSSVNIINFGTTNNCDVKIDPDSFSSKTKDLDCATRFSILNQTEFANKLTHIFHNTHHGFEYFAKGMWEIMRIIQQHNPKIELISTGSYLATTLECATIKNRDGTFDACKAKEVVDYFKPNERISSKIPEVKSLKFLYINKYALLCKDNQLGSCITHVGNVPMFYDQHHLSYEFARNLGELMGKTYRQEFINIGLPDPIKHQ
jgi:peptidoglycan/LPS O-acetylase OafA/YrhL